MKLLGEVKLGGGNVILWLYKMLFELVYFVLVKDLGVFFDVVVKSFGGMVGIMKVV